MSASFSCVRGRACRDCDRDRARVCETFLRGRDRMSLSLTFTRVIFLTEVYLRHF